ncbi:MAG: hypothetical protein ACLGSD_12825 [Acidobacteriota bacterium]
MATVLAPPPVTKRFNYQSLGSLIAKYPGVFVLVLTYIFGLLWLLYKSHWNVALFQTINASNIVGFLMPLIVTAAFIERAVEVVISPWRDKEGDRKSSNVQTASKLMDAAPGPDQAVSLQAATDDLNQYTGQTRRYAFALAFAFSVMAVTAGVRVLWPMLDVNALKSVPVDQQNYLRWYDMLLSTLLLAGGAAGIHAPISAVTGFFQKNS